MVTSGVASFSPYRRARWIHSIGVPSPFSRTRSTAYLLTGCKRIVVDLAPLDDRDVLVEQRDQLPDDPGLRLPAKARGE